MLRRTLGHVVRPSLPLRQYSQARAGRSHVKSHAKLEPLDSVSDIVSEYRAACPHPLLTLIAGEPSATTPIATGPTASNPTVEDALQAAGIAREQYDAWKPVINATTLSSALNAADSILGQGGHTNPSSRGRFPAWVLLALLRNKPASHTEAFVAHRIALAPPVTPTPELMPLVFILLAYWLTRLGMSAPLHSTIVHLTRTHFVRADHISLLLRILVAHSPPRAVLQAELSLLLKFAIYHHLPLSPSTYRAILDNHDTPPNVARLVEEHMATCGFTPNYVHTRALLRIYGQNGLRASAANSWRRIRHGEVHGRVPSYTSRKGYRSMDPDLRQAMNAKPTLPTTDDIHPNIWLQVLKTAAQDSKTSPDALLSVFHEGRQHISDTSVVRFATFLLIKSFVRREYFKEIAPLLADIMPLKDDFSTSQLTIVVEALTMLGRPDAACRLLQQHLGRATETSSGTTVPFVDTQMINSFMIALLRIGRPDAVFYIWDTMPRVFGVQPNAISFAIVLKAARFARKCEGTLQVALEDFGLRHILPSRMASSELERAPHKLNREQAIEGLERMLQRDPKRAVTGFWRGHRAGSVALRVARQIFLGNWPELARLETPVLALRVSSSAQATSPMSDLYRSILHPDEGTLGEDILGRASAVTPQQEGADTYYGILPHDPMFRALIDLLADEDRAWQIPLVLKWMQHLSVVPSSATLATALVYWAEVSLDGPWIEKIKGPGSSQYMRLRRWMMGWVGWKRMPRREDMQAALRRVQYFRDMRSLGAPARDVEVDVDAWCEK
ncbi:hypothetical protein GY45DRAFT_1310684 [Cubamyces sp. BRFM 1775]|nr:hypothetical protein GY45DRAFT_1310684 [Cubamyces sp. BRFM 1775]